MSTPFVSVVLRALLSADEHSDLSARDRFCARPSRGQSQADPLATWWARAARRNPDHPNRWMVSFGRGEHACLTFHQCTLQVESDGTIIYPFECTEGWG